ncbi:GNAT family N-acetyltransferase [bacterium SCSIO 12643]|nr:GNAT family N-acetyltransferase [bacterium SCSIO 12643]
MTYRTASIEDIPAILIVRNSVLENRLSDPNSITHEDCAHFMKNRGKTWVAEFANQIVGFAMIDTIDDRVWALFILPQYEKLGIGKQLHHMMLDWFFGLDKESVWLGTTPNTRAEGFYRKLGWQYSGKYGNDEIKFRMSRNDWDLNK